MQIKWLTLDTITDLLKWNTLPSIRTEQIILVLKDPLSLIGSIIIEVCRINTNLIGME